MKKLLGVFAFVLLSVVLISCGKLSDEVVVDEAHDYVITGQFAGWGDAVDDQANYMKAAAPADKRFKPIAKQLKDAKFIYVIEVTFPAEEAGWDVTYKIKGEEKTVDGNLTLKIIQVDKGGEAPNWWGQSPESGAFKSLTPDTLYLPPFLEENVDGAGGWNDNPIVFEAGTYLIVYVQYSNTSHGLAAIKK